MISRTVLLASAAGIALLASPAFAEDSAAADAATASSANNEIIVTAQRREEKAQEVPIALSVIGGPEIDSKGAFNINRLQQSQPSVQFYSSNPRNSAINIRGLGAPFGLTNDGIEQGVGFYIDGVYVGRAGASTFDFVDIQRVEILRGPQGTLYGKNTTAGAVNVTTRAPSFEPEGRVELSSGNYSFMQAKASVSGPIVADTLAARLSASYSKRDGTIDNVRTGEDLHRMNSFSTRGQLLWKPSSSLDFTLAGDYNWQNPLCCVQYYARLAPTQRPLARQYTALAGAFGYTPPTKDPFDRVTDLDADLNARQTMAGVSLTGNWDLGPATITSISAWRNWDWSPANDRDFIGLPITTVSANPSHQTQWSQELRLTSNGKTRLQYTLGAYYFHQKINTNGVQVQGSAASRWLLSGTDASNPNVLNGLTSTNTIRFSNDSFAVFGKLNWEPVNGLHIQPGVRVNYDKKSGYYDAVVSIANSQYNFTATAANVQAMLDSKTGTAKTTFQNQINTLAPQHYEPHFDDWNVSGDITLSYDFSQDIHGYATYAKSFKSGGINLSGLPLNSTSTGVDLTTQTVKPENVNHFEVGLKTQFLDHKVTLNLAGFWDEIKDYQTTVNANAVNVIRGYLANAPKVRVRGFEFDSAFRPSDRFNVYVNGAFTDAKFVKFTNAPCPPELAGGTAPTGTQVASPAGTAGGISPVSCNISGQVLPGISKWSVSWGGEYNVPLGGDGAEVYFGYDGSYRSRFSSNPSPSAYMYIDSYSLHNFRLGFRRDHFNIFGWVRNAFNEKYFELLSTQSGSSGLIVGQPGDPRTWGGHGQARLLIV
ncbi:TonB-dependent receptor [Novosphingobium sp. G106]|uniref:TonB-dependent receptor n=1 Tax=Novosphingobium sp. G106 TaxID=2849500 RepID=UPI001C2D34A1|nr:TonB-dependent receptor [Novosphingobium sp. G106]MBV1690146.1 TonB-dependent receptor [Novosphingobium sp. G106]